MTDPLTTRIAVALHGATPPNPDAALALHRAQAERVVAALGDVEEPVECRCMCHGGPLSVHHLVACCCPHRFRRNCPVCDTPRKALATAEEPRA